MHISKFCKFYSEVPPSVYTIDLTDNRIISRELFFDNGLSENTLTDYLDTENTSIMLIPFTILEGYWNNSANNGNWAIFSDTCNFFTRPHAKTINNVIEPIPARLTLDSSIINNDSYFLDNPSNSTFIFFSNININIQNVITNISIENMLSVWGLSNFNIVNNQAQELDDQLYNVMSLDLNGGYVEVTTKQDGELIWRSNYIEVLSGAKVIMKPMRYYITKRLSTENYTRISSSYSPYILLKVRFIVAHMTRFVIRMATSISGLGSNDSIIFEHEEELSNTIKEFIITTIDDNGTIISEADTCYFALEMYDNETLLNTREGVQCPAAAVELPALNVEPTGVSIGMLSSSNIHERKFEVGSDYTAHFYGKVEIFPVGAIYLSVTPENPGNYFYGEWERWGNGKMPLGVDESESSEIYNSVEQIGGAKTVKLTVNQIPPHNHAYRRGSGSEGDNNSRFSSQTTGNYGRVNTSTTGGGQPHNNMPPFITCYMWKRIR